MKRKIFSALLLVSMIFSMLSTTAFAYGEIDEVDNYHDLVNGGASSTSVNSRSFSSINTGVLDGVIETAEEQMAAIMASDLSKEEKAIAYEKITFEADTTDVKISPFADPTWKYFSGFSIAKQAETYYCVPASCRAAINYINGSADTQAVIAKALGTTTSGTPFSDAKTYLNSKQTRNTYIAKEYDTTLATMQSNFYSAVYTFDAPPLISVKLTTASGWAYDTNGHTMLVAGARSDKEEFRIADPYIQWEDSSASMFYTKTASAIRTAIYNRGTGYIY